MKRLLAFLAAAIVLAFSLVTAADANTSHTTSLGPHGGTRWTLERSVYVNLKAMTPGTWKQELWSGTCAIPGARLAVLPGLVVPNTRALTRTTKIGPIAMNAGVMLRLRLSSGTTIICGSYLPAPGPTAPTPTSSAMQSPSPSPSTTAVFPACTPTDQDQYVYSPDRLTLESTCLTITGTVDEVRTEDDGDLHILVRLDPAFSGYLTSANQGEERGDLVVEPVCVGPVTQADAVAVCASDPDPLTTLPVAGMRVWMQGRYVLDKDHGSWAELHPLYRWGIDSAPPPPSPSPSASPSPSPSPTATQGSGLPASVEAAREAGASAVCNDGTWSYSAHRSGTCSGHGGVYWWTGNVGPAGPGG